MIHRIRFTLCFLAAIPICCQASSKDLTTLKKDQTIGRLRVANLYADSRGEIVGAKFWHIQSGAPVYLLQIETVPQVFMWVDTPADSNAGIAHSLEHLLGGKGTKGRYLGLLTGMRLSRRAAATTDDFNLYSFSSGTGVDGFFEQFHAWLDALYRPDFSDLEAEREFYHFGISLDPTTKTKTLVEKGSVYDEMQPGQGAYSYYFELNRRVLGGTNPFGFDSSGVPDEMRDVRPADVRQAYREHYHLSPTTGFVFAVNRKEDVRRFLGRISRELGQFTEVRAPQQAFQPAEKPKYPVSPSSNTEVALFPFPSSSEEDRGEVRFGWKPTRIKSRTDLRLLQLFLRALADGDKSVLYKRLIDSKSRTIDSGATNVESLVFLENSPYFPAEFIGFSGIPGKQLTRDRVEQLRSRIALSIHEISQYPDHSAALGAFNKLVLSYAKAWRRKQSVWAKTPPQFGLNYNTEWKEYLEYLEMDPAFIRSITDDSVWIAAEKQIRSGTNVWREVIDEFHLLDTPYATASIPSPELLGKMDDARQERIAAKVKDLEGQSKTDEVQVLDRFEQEELIKTTEIDKIAAQVRRPGFTDHPPLTPDEGILYHRLHLLSVPVIATFFDRAPTIDLGLSFDLQRIPRKYYKYLPILPRCLDSLGLKTSSAVISYADLQTRTQTEVSEFGVRYDANPVSHRGDLRIEVSADGPEEFGQALRLIHQVTTLNYLDPANEDRLRDIVDKRLWEDDTFDAGENDFWFTNPASAFHYQDDTLYLALSSFYTRSHWDGRLKWLLHKPVSPEEIQELRIFAKTTLSDLHGMSGEELAQRLKKIRVEGLKRELLEYWERNFPAFPTGELLAGLWRLALEVEGDLTNGPDKAIAEIKDLQRIVLNRRALTVDLTLDRRNFAEIQPALAKYLQSIPDAPYPKQETPESGSEETPLMDNVRKRVALSRTDFPWYVGIDDPRESTASMVFYADFPGYSQLDRKSLLQVLSSNLISGAGPHTLYTKIEEDGLAYGSSISTDSSRRLLQYYAARSPDIPSLIEFVNSIVAMIPESQDEFLVDYAFENTFPIPRSMSTFTERGRSNARDILDGNTPSKVRQFSQAILKLRSDPALLAALTAAAADSIGPVLVNGAFTEQQRNARSLFFFVGSERLLTDAEHRLPIPSLLRLYSSDFWLDFSDQDNRSATPQR